MIEAAGEMPDRLIGSSAAAERLRRVIGLAAGSDAPVLLVGESGTGKDLAARMIHEGSQRSGGPFVTLTCSAVPEDIFDRELHGPTGAGVEAPYPSVPRHIEMAQGGTLYLDDVCRASPAFQARLLQLLRNGRFVDSQGRSRVFDARLIAATNTPISECLRNGVFRRDLYDTLAVVLISLPPLREREGDAAEIARDRFPRLLQRMGRPMAPLPTAAAVQLNGLHWPGNVRQLLNTLQHMALMAPASVSGEYALPADIDLPGDEPSEPAVSPEFDGTFAEIERRVILDTIARHGGSVQKAAEQLELAASTIYRKLKIWGEG